MPLFHEPPLFRFYSNLTSLRHSEQGWARAAKVLPRVRMLTGTAGVGGKTPPPPPGINDNQNALTRID